MGPSGRQVSDCSLERDLKFLLAVLNWAAKSRDEEVCLLLESNPLRGLKLPGEKNPARVLLTHSEYEAPPGSVIGDGLALPRRSGVRPRNGTPHRCHPQAPLVRH